jgi:hypothetical protein
MPHPLTFPRRLTPALFALVAVAVLALTATTVQAKPKAASKVVGVSTTFTLAPAVKDRIDLLGITLGVVAPATQNGPASATFPITKVRGPVHKLRGVIRHSGGLTLSRGARTVSLSDVVIVANGRRGYATAKVGQRRVAVFRLTAPKRTVVGSDVTLTADLRLTAQGARFLNRRMPSADLERGLLLGSAVLTGTLASSDAGEPAAGSEYVDPVE